MEISDCNSSELLCLCLLIKTPTVSCLIGHHTAIYLFVRAVSPKPFILLNEKSIVSAFIAQIKHSTRNNVSLKLIIDRVPALVNYIKKICRFIQSKYSFIEITIVIGLHFSFLLFITSFFYVNFLYSARVFFLLQCQWSICFFFSSLLVYIFLLPVPNPVDRACVLRSCLS